MAVIIHEVSFTTTKRYKWEARRNFYWRERERSRILQRRLENDWFMYG